MKYFVRFTHKLSSGKKLTIECGSLESAEMEFETSLKNQHLEEFVELIVAYDNPRKLEDSKDYKVIKRCFDETMNTAVEILESL